MRSTARLILSASLLALAPAAAVCAQAPVPATEAQQSAHDRLFDLFKLSDEASLRRNPLQALFRGDLRYYDRLGDLFSDAHYQAEKAADQHDLAALQAIPRGELNPTDQIAYDAFEYQTIDDLRGLQPDLLMGCDGGNSQQLSRLPSANSMRRCACCRPRRCRRRGDVRTLRSGTA